MNCTKMLELANFMENLEAERFNMGYWVSYFDYDEDDLKNVYQENEVLDINDCNTAGCIAGWVLALQNNGTIDVSSVSDDPYDYDFGVKNYAQISLGLSQSEADRLFLFNFGSVWFDHREDYGYTEYKRLGKEGVVEVYGIDEEEINPKHVADMLRRIVSGEVKL